MTSTSIARPWWLLLLMLLLLLLVSTGTALLTPASYTTHHRFRRPASLLLSAIPPRISEWQIQADGKVTGTVRGHPVLKDGDTIFTSPLQDTSRAKRGVIVKTQSGSKYRLGVPSKQQQRKLRQGQQPGPQSSLPASKRRALSKTKTAAATSSKKSVQTASNQKTVSDKTQEKQSKDSRATTTPTSTVLGGLALAAVGAVLGFSDNGNKGEGITSWLPSLDLPRSSSNAVVEQTSETPAPSPAQPVPMPYLDQQLQQQQKEQLPSIQDAVQERAATERARIEAEMTEGMARPAEQQRALSSERNMLEEDRQRLAVEEQASAKRAQEEREAAQREAARLAAEKKELQDRAARIAQEEQQTKERAILEQKKAEEEATKKAKEKKLAAEAVQNAAKQKAAASRDVPLVSKIVSGVEEKSSEEQAGVTASTTPSLLDLWGRASGSTKTTTVVVGVAAAFTAVVLPAMLQQDEMNEEEEPTNGAASSLQPSSQDTPKSTPMRAQATTSPPRGTQIVAKAQIPPPAQAQPARAPRPTQFVAKASPPKGTQVIANAQPPRPTQVVAKKAPVPRGTQVVAQASDVAPRPTQVIGQQPAVRAAQLIGRSNAAPRPTQVLGQQAPRGTQVIGRSDAAPRATQVIGQQAPRGTQVIGQSSAAPRATQVIGQQAPRGTQVIAQATSPRSTMVVGQTPSTAPRAPQILKSTKTDSNMEGMGGTGGQGTKTSYSPFGRKPTAAKNDSLYAPPMEMSSDGQEVSETLAYIPPPDDSLGSSGEDSAAGLSYMQALGGTPASTVAGAFSPFGAKPKTVGRDSLYGPPAGGAAASEQIFPQPVSFEEEEPVSSNNANYMEALGGAPASAVQGAFSPFGSKPKAVGRDSLYAPPEQAGSVDNSAETIESPPPSTTGPKTTSGSLNYMQALGGAPASAVAGAFSPFRTKPKAAKGDTLYTPPSQNVGSEEPFSQTDSTFEEAEQLSPQEFDGPIGSTGQESGTRNGGYLQALGGALASAVEGAFSPFGRKPKASMGGSLYNPPADYPQQLGSEETEFVPKPPDVAPPVTTGAGNYMEVLGGTVTSGVKGTFSPFGANPKATSNDSLYTPPVSGNYAESVADKPHPASGANYMDSIGGSAVAPVKGGAFSPFGRKPSAAVSDSLYQPPEQQKRGEETYQAPPIAEMTVDSSPEGQSNKIDYMQALGGAPVPAVEGKFSPFGSKPRAVLDSPLYVPPEMPAPPPSYYAKEPSEPHEYAPFESSSQASAAPPKEQVDVDEMVQDARSNSGGSYLDALAGTSSTAPAKASYSPFGGSFKSSATSSDSLYAPPDVASVPAMDVEDAPKAEDMEPMKGNSVVEERIRLAYMDWNKYFNNGPIEQERFPIFAENFRQAETYHQETGESGYLNEWADLTEAEYLSRQ